MSERRIGDGKMSAILEYGVSARACAGAPEAIQPGAVVALAEALEHILVMQTRGYLVVGDEATKQARAALALYNGTGVVDETA